MGWEEESGRVDVGEKGVVKELERGWGERWMTFTRGGERGGGWGSRERGLVRDMAEGWEGSWKERGLGRGAGK